jgi:acyl carrier protein
MSDVSTRVRKIVSDKLRVDESKVVDGANFVDDLGADSLDQAELVMMFEDEFGCEIPEDAAAKLTTIKSAIDYIAQNSAN